MAKLHGRICDLAPHDRPRERLARLGAAALADPELLALVIGSGTLGEGAAALGARLLADVGGLAELARLGFDDLAGRRGIGSAKAARVQAAVELGRRLASSRGELRIKVDSPEVVERLVGPELRTLHREHFRVLLLDARGRHLCTAEIYRGTADGARVRLAEVFRPAVVANARRIVLVHNHPAGDPRPSEADLELTRAAVAMGRGLGIEVDDHVVMAADGCVSMRRDGLVRFSSADGQVAADNSTSTRRATSTTRRTTRSG